MTPEGRVKAKLKKALAHLGPHWVFMPVQSGYGKPALDYILCYKGRFISIETKKPGGQMTPLQLSTKAQIEAAGGIVLLVWDEDSLALAMKIVLALEFDTYDHGDGRENAAHLPEEAARLYQQHLREVQSGKAPKQATGGDHGAFGAAPQ